MTTRDLAQTAALVPVKGFAGAKRRLADVLSPVQRASLAEAMLRDVVTAARQCGEIDRVILLGGADARRLAGLLGVEWLDDTDAPDLNTALTRAAQRLADKALRRVLVLPGDLPTVQSAQIAALLARHEQGLTVCPAQSDGGTNALVISPPDALEFCFGPDSARRHLAAALAAGLPAHKESLAAFARDVDGPADLRWLATQPAGACTADWLADQANAGPAARRA